MLCPTDLETFEITMLLGLMTSSQDNKYHVETTSFLTPSVFVRGLFSWAFIHSGP